MDLFNRPIQTRSRIVRQMRPATVAALIAEVRKKLPLGHRWPHQFLRDLDQQIVGGYRKNLSPKQTGALLRYADFAGVRLELFTEKNDAKR